MLNKEEIKSNEEVKTTLEAMYDKLSEANSVLEKFEVEVNENDQ